MNEQKEAEECEKRMAILFAKTAMILRQGSCPKDEVKKSKARYQVCVTPISMMGTDEIMKTISQAGYLVKKELKEGVRMTAPSCSLDVFIRRFIRSDSFRGIAVLSIVNKIFCYSKLHFF